MRSTREPPRILAIYAMFIAIVIALTAIQFRYIERKVHY